MKVTYLSELALTWWLSYAIANIDFYPVNLKFLNSKQLDGTENELSLF